MSREGWISYLFFFVEKNVKEVMLLNEIKHFPNRLNMEGKGRNNISKRLSNSAHPGSASVRVGYFAQGFIYFQLVLLECILYRENPAQNYHSYNPL